MSEVIVQGQKFRIKGEEPTEKENLAIETYLSGKKQNTNFDFDKELELMISPQDILTDAEKGKYNKKKQFRNIDISNVFQKYGYFEKIDISVISLYSYIDWIPYFRPRSCSGTWPSRA